MKSEIDITSFLHIVADYVRDKQVPVVDLIAVQTRDPFKVLVATILSARTKDETTAKAASRLFKKAETPEALAKLSVEELEKLEKNYVEPDFQGSDVPTAEMPAAPVKKKSGGGLFGRNKGTSEAKGTPGPATPPTPPPSTGFFALPSCMVLLP